MPHSTAPALAAAVGPELRRLFNGRLILPDDAGYDSARTVFYGGFDRRPAAIVQASNANEVARVVLLAREAGLELAVRSGGHSVAGHGVCEGGIVLDLSALRSMQIDAAARSAWAGAGLTAGEYTANTGAHGLATGFGDAGGVGIAGITLGGGVGYLLRSHGLTIDDLLAAELVTADGQVLHVDEATHPDLFWAIRGGGGNFGVATRLQYRLHELPTVVGGMMILPATPAIVSSFVAAAEAAPDALTTIAMVMKAPPMPFVPASHHGRPIVFALMAWAGDAASGARALAPFRALAAPVVDEVREVPYAAMYPPAEAYHPVVALRSMFLERLDLGVAETILAHIETSTAQMAAVQLRVLGGAMARVPVAATAFAHRRQRIMANVAAMYADASQAAEHRAWVDTLAAALHQGDDGVYVNFLGAEGPARVRNAYPGATWERLAQIKRQWDPTNLFRLNQNIPPAP